MSMAQTLGLLGVPCQPVVLLVVLLFVSAGHLRGLQAASYCKAKLAEEGLGLEDASWADSGQTINLRAEIAEMLEENGVAFYSETPLQLTFLVQGGRRDPALWNGVGLNGPLASRKSDSLVLGFSLPNPLEPSSLRDVYELPQAEVEFYVNRREDVDYSYYRSFYDGAPNARWRASAGYLMPSRPKKRKRCADESSGTDVSFSVSHLVCLELCRWHNVSQVGAVDHCHDQVGVSLALPVVRDAHLFFAEGTIESLPSEGDPLRFQPAAMTTRRWRGNHKYSLVPEVAKWCPAVGSSSSGVVGESNRYPYATAYACQGIADTWNDRDTGPRRYSQHPLSVWKVAMHSTLNPTCFQGTGSYLECGPFTGNSTVSSFVFERRSFGCSGGRLSAGFGMTPMYSSLPQGSLVGGASQETGQEDFLLIAEGVVDVRDTSLCMVACWKRPRQDPNSAEICEDCRIGIKLQGPGPSRNVTILDRNMVTVTVSSLRTETDPFFFKAITFRGRLRMEQHRGDIAEIGSKYVYTKVDLASQECDVGVPKGPAEDVWYNNWNDWLSAEIVNSDHTAEIVELPDILSQPSIRGERLQLERLDRYASNNGSRCPQGVSGLDCVTYGGQLDVSYRLFNANGSIGYSDWYALYLDAEGTYDSAQGRLCLIACRNLMSQLVGGKNVTALEGEAFKDCQMSLTAVISYNTINGTLRSLRDASDPLYFKPMVFRSYDLPSQEAHAILWVQDIEALESLVAISLSILCIWVQLRHSHRRPKYVPQLSLTMLCTLTAGYAIPLVLQSDVFIFLHTPNSGNEGSRWHTGDVEVLLRVLAVFAVLFLVRLTWRVSSAQKLGEQPQAAWNEAKVLLISMALYVLGWLIASNLNVSESLDVDKRVFSGAPPTADYDVAPSSPPLPLLFSFTRKDLKKFVGLILDWFLLPQVVANVVWNVGPVQPVSQVFYWGLTFGRSFLHLHNIWRSRELVFPHAGFEEMFASPTGSWNFLFLSWDIMASGVSVILAMVLFVQQRSGGRWFCCRSPPTDAETELSESCKPLNLSP